MLSRWVKHLYTVYQFIVHNCANLLGQTESNIPVTIFQITDNTVLRSGGVLKLCIIALSRRDKHFYPYLLYFDITFVYCDEITSSLRYESFNFHPITAPDQNQSFQFPIWYLMIIQFGIFLGPWPPFSSIWCAIWCAIISMQFPCHTLKLCYLCYLVEISILVTFVDFSLVFRRHIVFCPLKCPRKVSICLSAGVFLLGEGILAILALSAGGVFLDFTFNFPLLFMHMNFTVFHPL